MIKSVAQYLTLSAKNYPNKTAFQDRSGKLSFLQLYNKSRSLAKAICFSTAMKTNLPVAVFLPKGTDCITAFFAAAYSGNFYTPLDVLMPLARLEKIIEILKPSIVITNDIHISDAKKIAVNAEVINIDSLGLMANETDLQLIENNITDSDPLYVMFTSGSTGVPKGVVISHRSVIDYANWLSDTFNFNSDTVFGNQAPFYFDNSILDIYSTVKNGCTTIIIPEDLFLSPKRLCKYIDEQNINTIFWVPSALILVANSDALSVQCPKTLKQILFCGEVMPAKQLNNWIKALPNALYANLYGPTEITDVCTYYIVNREFCDGDSLPIGTPCNNTGIIVLNEKNEEPAQGEIGELCIKGTCLAYGYYNNAEKTHAAFVQNPLNQNYSEIIYRTGDLVHFNSFGELMFDGRKDFQIKHLGHRIELGEIETVAGSCKAVAQCCALYNAEMQAICLFATPAEIDKAQLFSHLKAYLPRYMLPTRIITASSLPLNSNGKIDRVNLKAYFKRG